MDVQVEIIREASHELVDAFGRLLPQLSSTAKPLDYEALDRMVTCDANTVLVGEAARGRGVARLLTLEALRIARESTVYRFSLDD